MCYFLSVEQVWTYHYTVTTILQWTEDIQLFTYLVNAFIMIR